MPGRQAKILATSQLGDRLLFAETTRYPLRDRVGASFGIGLTLEAPLGANFAGVVYREIRDGTGPVRLGHSANWRDDNENTALAGFLQLLRERYPSPST
jgi:hypothetical protein